MVGISQVAWGQTGRRISESYSYYAETSGRTHTTGAGHDQETDCHSRASWTLLSPACPARNLVLRYECQEDAAWEGRGTGVMCGIFLDVFDCFLDRLNANLESLSIASQDRAKWQTGAGQRDGPLSGRLTAAGGHAGSFRRASEMRGGERGFEREYENALLEKRACT